MRVIFTMIIFFSYILLGIEIDIKPDSNITVSNQDIQNMIGIIYKKKRIKLTQKASREYVEGNRLLSNELLKRYKKIPSDVLLRIRLKVEEELADFYIRRNLEAKKIDVHTLKSYYIAHKKDFYLGDKVKIIDYKESTFEQALDVYNKIKTGKIVRKQGRERVLYLKKNSSFIGGILQKYKEGEVIHPILLNDGYHVFLIVKKEKGEFLKFDNAKNLIRNILLNKIYSKERRSLIKEAKND